MKNREMFVNRYMLLLIIFLATIDCNALTTTYNGVLYTLDKTNLTASVGQRSGETGGIVSVSRSVTSVEIPEEIISGDKTYRVTSITRYAFSGCDKMTSITLPSTLLSVDIYAFRDCSLLTEICFKGSLVSIGEGAFYQCSSLQKITLPNTVTSIGARAFYKCSNLQNIEFPTSLLEIPSRCFEYCTALTFSSIPNSITSIGDNAFSRCENIKKLDIPNSVNTIGEYAFSYCSSLSSVIIGENVTSIGNSAFLKCPTTRLFSKIKTPVAINSSAFYQIAYYQNPSDVILYVPYGTKTFYDNLTGWRSISNIVENGTPINGYIKGSDGETLVELSKISEEIENNEVQIGRSDISAIPNTYEGTFVIPEVIKDIDKTSYKVVAINNNAFKDCSLLTTIIIPSSITRIGKAFNGCESITSIHSNIRSPQLVDVDVDCFEDISDDAVLYVPAGTKERYTAIDAWNVFSQIIESSPISAGDVTARYGSNADLPVFLKNTETISGLQFKLTLPEGVTVVDNEGSLVASTTERTEGFTIMGRKDPDEENSYLFVVLSLSGDVISGTEGAFMNVRLDIAQNVELGVHNIKIEDVYMATNTFDTQNPAESTSELTVKDFTSGDSNGDGVVDVTDIVGIANAILGRAGNTFDPLAADLNGDGVFDVTDIVVLANQILHGNSQPGVKAFNISDLLDPQ